ncbi:hypothetical protein JNB_00250 [Janibacter sp. HTCC2649]|uniref:PD-(D/E)XK motif protein n=1 Tax=Janibacter sp. HTCC2649 TaxID=313589 RepID=UPI000066E9E7|nr:PD-(D/E)XK motif protein [Janibacter sp. HTCC2649]EAP98552.1 hypothetical protein JNB_00250 [Janibacter sp. HTCC2649]
MIDLAQEFVYVQNDLVELDETKLISRLTDFHLPAGAFRVAVDSEHHKHALFPVGLAVPEIEEKTAAVSCRTRELVLDGRTMRFVDLECTDSSLELVFEHLVADVIERVDVDPSNPGRSCLEALTEWRELMRVAKGSLPRETTLGLIGELQALGILGTKDPENALMSWSGPSRSTHDFVHVGRHLEVKATATVDGQTIRVSNVDQLDPETSPEALHLLVVHCALDPVAPDLDQRIRELIAQGFPKTRLIKAVADYGYVFESGQDAPRFAVRSLRLWEVDHDFPGLRATDIPLSRRPAVTRLSYDLSLAAAPEPIVDEVMLGVLGGWLDT